MPNRSLTIRGTEVGLDINKVSIYKDSISSSNLVGTVDKSIFMSGYSFIDDDQQEDYVCQGDDPCRTVLNLSIRSANQPPTVTITGATSSLTNTNVTLTANANDPEGFPLTYLWSTGETTQSITVTSATAQTATYEVTVTDDIGDTGSDTHNIVWTVPATTTTTQPPATTTTTQAPTPFVQINGVTAAQVNDTITLTGEDYNFTGSTWSWTGGAAAGLTSKTINITESSAGSVTYGVTVDGTYTDTHTVNWSTTPTTTTTTTQAPATTTTTTTQAPATTTTTTQAPGYWNLRICSNGTLANQQVQDDGNINAGDVFLAGNGICYEVDNFQSNQSGGLQIIVSEFGNCQECLDANGGV
jgi:hypothetical protein